jgi:hypothetical protein
LHNQYTFLKNEGMDSKIGPVWQWLSVGGGRQMERGKEGEYRECILYFCMKIEN